MEEIDAIVIWFQPANKEVDAIRLYADSVRTVYVVDNSENDNAALLTDITNAVYMPLYANKGIAFALNRGCEAAYHRGAEWVLTMDQDSRWDQTSLSDFLNLAKGYPQISKTGLFAPYHDYGVPNPKVLPDYQEEEMVMCSGNLLRLAAWREAGGFREDFFIDEVDDELCLHLHRLGYLVVRVNSARLTHPLGQGVQTVRLIQHPYIPHPAWRLYYMGRNMRRMQELYPEQRAYYKKQIRKRKKRLWLYDWTDKMNKLRAFYRGLRDGRRDTYEIRG